ncbi:uncharacterized protein LOC129766500 [Toxorhynchites rutilus septentrionalis]|uniref:uncharacterized protein LOC129766500 n=1 Tax=Toxorhynchites rutilus septentrionalis TaxID=329112 RepID=UPI00247ABE69|nr:uncharacterized protein LOC129766500 [Toxorhynchites rutilus septentrionalis]
MDVFMRKGQSRSAESEQQAIMQKEKVIRLPAKTMRLLDLAFSSEPDDVNLIEPSTPVLEKNEHLRPFIIKLDAQSNSIVTSDSESSPQPNFRLCDYGSLNNDLSIIDWQQILTGDSVDALADRMYAKLYEIIYACAPIQSGEAYFMATLEEFSITKFTECTAKNSLRIIELQYNELLKSCHKEYVKRTEANLKRNPLEFWKFVKSQRSGNRIPETVIFNGITASTPLEVANLFAKFFNSVYNINSPPLSPMSFSRIQGYDFNITTLQFSPHDVMKVLVDMDASKGPGADGIPPSLLKYCASLLASPISCLFNRSLSERSFPSVWKITTIHGQVFETLVHNALYNVVHPVISELQHGFVQQRSTTTNFMCYTNILFREVESRRQVDSIYIDFSKAFDTVPHQYAIAELKAVGYPPWLVEWFYPT